MNTGKIVQIIGPVVDAEFAGGLPAIYNALTVDFDVPGEGQTRLTLEVQQHLGDHWIRAVAMSSTEGLKRGMELTDVGAPIRMPVGEAVMGRVFNVTGEAVDEQGPVETAKDLNGKDIFNPIHRAAPLFTEQSTSRQVLTTGIKVIDLICPFLKGGKVGAFGGAAVQQGSGHSDAAYVVRHDDGSTQRYRSPNAHFKPGDQVQVSGIRLAPAQ